MRNCMSCALVVTTIAAATPGQAVAQTYSAPHGYDQRPIGYYYYSPGGYYYYYGPLLPGGYYPPPLPSYGTPRSRRWRRERRRNHHPAPIICHRQLRVDPTTRRLIAPLDCRGRNSRKANKRPNRPSFSASSSPTPRPSPPAPSSSTPRTRLSIWYSARVKPCATASAWAAQGSHGRALSASAA